MRGAAASQAANSSSRAWQPSGLGSLVAWAARAAWAACVARVACARLAALPSGRPPALTPPRVPASAPGLGGPGLGPRVTSQRAGVPLLALVLDDLRPVPAQGEAGAQAAEAAISYLRGTRARGG